MLKLFERDIAAADQRLIVLAPANRAIPRSLKNVTQDSDERQDLIHEMQRLRGSIYLKDGALTRAQLTADGRHETPEDEKAWHILVTNENREVTGCIWYLEHESSPTIDDLRVRNCPLTTQDEWRDKLRAAVNNEVSRARHDRISYAEVGGWAVACGSQCVSAALLLILGTYSLSQIAGGALVLATATVRHSSAKILRRLGGSHLEGNGYTVPSYYDSRYDCEMELLRFDTRRPTAKYAGLVNMLKGRLADVQVIATDSREGYASSLGFENAAA